MSDKSNELPMQANILLWAGNDPERAHVMLRYLYLRSEFPIGYFEALVPVKFPLDVTKDLQPWLPPTWLTPANYPMLGYQNQILTANPSFQFKLPAQFTYQLQLNGKVPSSSPSNSESSAMLLMALQKPRKGTGGPFSPDETLGPGALRDTDNDGVLEIVDLQSVPIGYWRFPQANPDVLTLPNTLDPGAKLVDPAWNNLGNYLSVWLFEDLTGIVIHDQSPPRPSMPATWVPGVTLDPSSGVAIGRTDFAPIRYSTRPVIGVAGRDRLWGVSWRTMQSDGTAASSDNSYNYNLH